MAPKRKRSSILSEKPNEQPSSRDALAGDARDAVLQEVDGSLKSNDDERLPVSKRTRSDASDENPPEKSNSRPKRSKQEEERLEDALERGEGGERGMMKMPDPPKAGLVDPKGYHTNPPPVGRPVRVYADGVFDLFHLGHMRQLQQAKQAFPSVHLIVGVTGDKETHRRKGLTVLSAKERAESVRHCKWVDEVVEDCPWIIADAPEFMDRYKIDYVAHDDIPYGAEEGDDIYAPIKKAGKFLVTQRTEGVSTTGIITKIVRDYDQYITRQLNRGTPRQELNVSWLKKNELDIKRSMAELRDNIRTNWTTTGQELGRELRQFWTNSRPSSPARAGNEGKRSGRTSPAFERVSPRSNPTAANGGGNRNADFVAGYSLGLLGGVTSWMARSRRNLNDNRGDSDSAEDSSPVETLQNLRGRKGQTATVQDEVDAQVEHEMT